jgi:hypothetical protein
MAGGAAPTHNLTASQRRRAVKSGARAPARASPPTCAHLTFRANLTVTRLKNLARKVLSVAQIQLVPTHSPPHEVLARKKSQHTPLRLYNLPAAARAPPLQVNSSGRSGAARAPPPLPSSPGRAAPAPPLQVNSSGRSAQHAPLRRYNLCSSAARAPSPFRSNAALNGRPAFGPLDTSTPTIAEDLWGFPAALREARSVLVSRFHRSKPTVDSYVTTDT